MGQKLKISGWVALGVLAGSMATFSLQTVARSSVAPLPLEELQQLSAVFGLIKSDYVEPVDDKKLITDAISGMVSSLDPHSSIARLTGLALPPARCPPCERPFRCIQH
jgi:carboxyl-terminal processing protease